jgi:hypothetical protein
MQRGADKMDRPGERGDRPERGGWGERPRRERPRFGDDAVAPAGTGGLGEEE